MEKSRVQQTAHFYNKTSSVYHYLLHPFFHKGRKLAADRLQGKTRVYDLGCHDGIFSTYLAKSVQYQGIDIAERCIKKAKEKHPDKLFEKHDINTLNLEIKPNDALVLHYVLSVVKHPHQTLAHLSKQMTSGSELHIVNHFSNKRSLQLLDKIARFFFPGAVNFYFPLEDLHLDKDFIFVHQKRVNCFWTYLILKRK